MSRTTLNYSAAVAVSAAVTVTVVVVVVVVCDDNDDNDDGDDDDDDLPNSPETCIIIRASALAFTSVCDTRANLRPST